VQSGFSFRVDFLQEDPQWRAEEQECMFTWVAECSYCTTGAENRFRSVRRDIYVLCGTGLVPLMSSTFTSRHCGVLVFPMSERTVGWPSNKKQNDLGQEVFAFKTCLSNVPSAVLPMPGIPSDAQGGIGRYRVEESSSFCWPCGRRPVRSQ
jgi:hypothetical protein